MRRVENNCEARGAIIHAPLPPLPAYIRCSCGTCRECRSNAKWDRIFAKFEIKDYGQERKIFRSPLDDL